MNALVHLISVYTLLSAPCSKNCLQGMISDWRLLLRPALGASARDCQLSVHKSRPQQRVSCLKQNSGFLAPPSLLLITFPWQMSPSQSLGEELPLTSFFATSYPVPSARPKHVLVLATSRHTRCAIVIIVQSACIFGLGSCNRALRVHPVSTLFPTIIHSPHRNCHDPLKGWIRSCHSLH